MDALRTDISLLTGKLISGDITPMVFELIKDSPYVDNFIKEYKDYLPKERSINVSEQDANTNTSKDSPAGLDFEEWLANSGKPITL